MRLAGKVAIVTGAGAGIGRATAVLFAREGAKVVVVNRDPQRGADVLNEIRTAGGEAIRVQADVSQSADVQRMVREAVAIYNRVDILVNNAGIFIPGNVVQTSEADWQHIMDVNLTGVFLGMKYAIPQMVEQGGGSIVNISSEAGLVGICDMLAYSVSKAGIVALTRSTALDFVARHIRVNCVCPGRVLTPLVEEHIALSEDREAARIRLSSDRPMMRMGEVDEIAAGILYLASDESPYATGAVLAIDGGYTCR
jgi:meso-butanediol dehydrogenase / (S,S)-butanediol dehydrogenase / diacetyl reductase